MWIGNLGSFIEAFNQNVDNFGIKVVGKCLAARNCKV